MADLDPAYRRELAEQIHNVAPIEWGVGEQGDHYEFLVDNLIHLGWAYPPKKAPVVEVSANPPPVSAPVEEEGVGG